MQAPRISFFFVFPSIQSYMFGKKLRKRGMRGDNCPLFMARASRSLLLPSVQRKEKEREETSIESVQSENETQTTFWRIIPYLSTSLLFPFHKTQV